MSRSFLVSYMPLVGSADGRAACEELNLQPFIDGSIRREPDFEHPHPAISGLCRGSKFVSRLRVGDLVVHVTKSGRFGQGTKQRRLTSVLRVTDVLDSHEDAASWYESRGLRLPSNCMVTGNPCVPIEQSHRQHRDAHLYLPDSLLQLQNHWNDQYMKRSRRCPNVAICEKLFSNLSWTASVVRMDGDQYQTNPPGVDRRTSDRLQREERDGQQQTRPNPLKRRTPEREHHDDAAQTR